MQKLEIYSWEGISRRGERLRGTQTATDVAAVRAELRRQGIFARRIRKTQRFFSAVRPISHKDITMFTRQMATMLLAGIPLIQSLDLVTRGYTKTLARALLGNIKTSIEGGNSVAEALKKHPHHFNELYVNLIHAGECSGQMDTMFDRLANYREKIESLKGKIKKALFYPISVILVAVSVTIAMLVFVVPQLQALFSGFGAELPFATQLVIQVSTCLQHNSPIFLSFFLFLIWGIRFIWSRFPKLRLAADRICLKLPILGALFTKVIIARFARTLAITFAAGLPLVEALEAVGGATGHRIYASATHHIQIAISTGQTLKDAMLQTKCFPPLVIHMVAIGEASGTLEKMLNKIADLYEEEVDNAVDGLSSLIEPIIMIVLGSIIGGLVIAMYLPIFRMGSVV